MFDPLKFIGMTDAGKVYELGPDYGFDDELTAWYQKQYRLGCASPKDVTTEILRGSSRIRNWVEASQSASRPLRWDKTQNSLEVGQ